MTSTHAKHVAQIQVRSTAKNKTSRTVEVTYDHNTDGDLPILTIDSTEYLVEEVIADARFGENRSFLLTKIDRKDPENTVNYTTVLGCEPDGHDDKCDCEGFAHRKYCKHCDVLRNLVTTGVIDHPLSYDWPEVEAMPEPEPESEPREWVRVYEEVTEQPQEEYIIWG